MGDQVDPEEQELSKDEDLEEQEQPEENSEEKEQPEEEVPAEEKPEDVPAEEEGKTEDAQPEKEEEAAPEKKEEPKESPAKVVEKVAESPVAEAPKPSAGRKRGSSFVMPKFGGLMPKVAVEEVTENNPDLRTVEFRNNAMYHMKPDELTCNLAKGLALNTCLVELSLVECQVGDMGAAALGDALSQNKALIKLDLEGNRIKSDGATAIAVGLKNNTTLRSLNMLNQLAGRSTFGDACLSEFINMFETNVTLLKISWNLDSRKSFGLQKLITRNNEINRRLLTSRDYKDILPAVYQADPPTLEPYNP
mmetsp:Transcript_9984/g.11607  ORF Transcript_9984/g.11607 Transcript_9984/m.11607 type:complete len:307 (-) Transcript_9984:311-1231(-)|eukprot:CAMPEP_0197856980 /NCGR_PEP_ID=MMETSP1438-20131217/29600_1 /TAXON_ID=1461541 /ORGANISM="Pterosperma sp., Strain CCMP1384" /LENGTH=306 /DNA_ID=CAMNT_0043472637 /DNA_START=153 /DNA_END=1073 /DNA_ORIENTATION=-